MPQDDDLTLAHESVDEAFARVLERWDEVGAMGSPAGYVFQVARNLSRRQLRRAAIEHRLLRQSARVPEVPPPAGEVWDLVSTLPP